MQLIFGSSSGIGFALSQKLLEAGSQLELFTHRPEDLAKQIPPEKASITAFDGLQQDTLDSVLEHAFASGRQIEAVYIIFGTGYLNRDFDPQLESETIQLNANAFVSVASHAMRHFKRQGFGKLIGISSVAAVRGSPHAPAYNASKALVANYLEGLRLFAAKELPKVQVTEIRPGFINTAMMKTEKPFWVIEASVAADYILSAVEQKKRVAYVPRKWGLIAWLIRILPEFIYQKL